MQNNVTELTNRLLRALDNNYNVIDMPAVIEIVSLLEKVSITKELLETTRLGKHVNELRRKTDNDSLSKRAKELVKKWRNMVLPDSTNGQLKQTELVDSNKKRPLTKSPPMAIQEVKRAKLNGQLIQQIGTSELDMSDNSNSSFKDVINSTKLMKRDVILINSDSNSSFPEMKPEPLLEQQLPKKRGRKKGSKNHKNLLDEAETSFTNKLAVSRGNSKVKTTQELIAGLQNKNNTNSSTNPNLGTSPIKSKEDLNIRAAKLTERVSIIDQKLNTNANRYKNSQKKNLQTKIHLGGEKSDRIIESGSVINDKSLIIKQEQQTDEEVIVVDDFEPTVPVKGEVFDQHDSFNEDSQQQIDEDVNKVRSLSVEEAMAQLPPIDKTILDDENIYRESTCTCMLKESENIVSEPNGEDDVEDEESVIKSNLVKKYEFIEDSECGARLNIKKYEDESVLTPNDLHTKCLENINGNWGVGLGGKSRPELAKDGLYVNVVPNVNIEHIPKDVKRDFSCENYKKYNVSECDSAGGAAECGEDDRRTAKVINNCVKQEEVEEDEESAVLQQQGGDEQDAKRVFREWHEVLDKPSYNGEILKILPYVIID